MPETGNTLTLETTKGPVVIELRPDLAPDHVADIKKLADEKFYDGVAFHRVIEGFIAQTGCPHGTGTGGSIYPKLNAEFNSEPHVRAHVPWPAHRTKIPPTRNSLSVLLTHVF